MDAAPRTIYPQDYADVRDIWVALGIHDPLPYILLVRKIREVDDMKRGENVDAFQWELRLPEAKELKIIEEIKAETGADVRFEPPGTFYQLLARSEICRVPDPQLRARDQIPRIMWQHSALPDGRDRRKISKCARLALSKHNIYMRTQWNEVDQDAKLKAAKTLEETLKLDWLYDGLWFYIWLLYQCRKNQEDVPQSVQGGPSGGRRGGYSVQELVNRNTM